MYIFSRIQIFSIVGSLVLISFLVFFIRKRKLLEEYSILWLIVFIVFLAAAVFGAFLDGVARFFGILYPPAALFVLLILGIFFLLFHFSIVISEMKRKLNKLAIDKALLEERIKSMEKPK